jgi:hypothetical protein
MKFTAFRWFSICVVGVAWYFASVPLEAAVCRCPKSPGPGGGVQCANDQIATCDPSSGECNCTCDAVERGKSKEEYEALIFSRALHTTINSADLSSPQYHKLVSSFRKGKDQDEGTFYFEKEGGPGRAARVKIGVPEWLADILAGNGMLNGPGASLQNCPNGICIGGNNSGTATVNNFGVRWRLTPDEKHQFIENLKRAPAGTVSVWAVETGQVLGENLYEALKAAGWHMQESEVQLMFLGHPMHEDIDVFLHGEPGVTGSFSVFDPTTVNLMSSLKALKRFRSELGRSEKVASGTIKISVGPPASE